MKSDATLARAVAFPRVVNIADLRRLARRRLPPVVFAYIDGGAEDEVTLRDNCRAFGEVAFRPRQCVPVPACDLRTSVLGTPLELPFMLAPVGFCRMFYPLGEVHAARAANAAGIGFILSTFSGTRIEEVREGAERAALVPAVCPWRSRGGGGDDGARPRRGIFDARRHHRHAGLRHARA